MRISDWSSDVCSSDLAIDGRKADGAKALGYGLRHRHIDRWSRGKSRDQPGDGDERIQLSVRSTRRPPNGPRCISPTGDCERRSAEHTSELQSLMRNPYAVFCM